MSTTGADRKTPKTKSKTKLEKFYHEHGLAAGKIGRTEQELSDLEKALTYAKTSKSKKLMYYAHVDLSLAQFTAGLYIKGIKNKEKALKNASAFGSKMVMSAILAKDYARGGQFVAAKRKMAQSRQVMRQGTSAKTWKKWGSWWGALLKSSQGQIFESKGEYEKAENMYSSSLDSIDRSLKQGNPNAKKYGGVARQQYRILLSRMLEANGKIVEAELVIRRALLDRLKETGLYSARAPRIVLRFASHLAFQGRYDESRQPPGQPHHFDIAPRLTFKPPAQLNLS